MGGFYGVRDKPVGGPLWEDIGEMLRSRHAREIPQVIARNPPGEEERFIRQTDSMRLINVDAGLCKIYGGHNAYLKIAGGKIYAFEKIKTIWLQFVRDDKVQKKQTI